MTQTIAESQEIFTLFLKKVSGNYLIKMLSDKESIVAWIDLIWAESWKI